MLWMAKTTSINLRISPEFRAQIEQLADYHGLSMSSYAHSMLVKAIRQEMQRLQESDPMMFKPRKYERNTNTFVHPAKIKTVTVQNLGETSETVSQKRRKTG